ncbi:MAG: 50S ribosomal protein L17 [Bdellovibrionales bacterium CG10_big_fil_rev_8_21_14_0_10_45_34]|nr:MAG: 50S ribosomal protein L17 [Bdellovibrionales bacterium CG10_big_fil_rev_8_21_14_0_10_45_34]
MRHKSQASHFGRRPGPRKALVRGLVGALVENGRIQTTVAKAKELRRHAERAVTLGKRGGLHARRLLLARYPNKAIVERIVGDLANRFADRAGGYTRIIKIGKRAGDAAEMAIIEWVDHKLAAIVSGGEQPAANKKVVAPENKDETKTKVAAKRAKVAKKKAKKQAAMKSKKKPVAKKAAKKPAKKAGKKAAKKK